MRLAANTRNVFSGRVVGLGMGRQAFAGSGLIAILCMQAIAGPEGERVVHGSAQFARNGNNTVIHAANNTIIDYRSFNIGANESVEFVQPGAMSRVLNRVPNSVNPTRIDGSLRANGIVYIVNSAGVYFGNHAVVNAAGVYAAAGQITNSDFLNNVNHFTNLSGTVSNAGTINAGAAALIGKHAENLGTINAERGLVTMAAGDDVYIGEVGGTFMVQVAGGGDTSSTPGVNNAGTINAPGGTVRLAAGDMYSLALKMPGRIAARDVKLEAQGRGTAIVSGTIDASGSRPGERGGTVQVLGDRVGIAGATIDASGPAGGGEILIGGDFQGRGDVRTASRTTVTEGSTIRADATDQGDAGKVIVWSDGITRYHGSISAKGGVNGGDGGFVEVSGKGQLDFNGAADTRASSGRDGTILLDPEDIVIQQAANPNPDGDGEIADGEALFADGGAVTFTLGEAALEALTGNITLQATRDISVQAGVTLDLVNQGDTEVVTFQAGRNITVDGTITTSGADIVLSANDPGGTQADGSIFVNAPLSTAGAGGVAGDISLQVHGGTGSVQLGANLQTDGGNITFAGPAVLTTGVTLDTEQGDDGAAGNVDIGDVSASGSGFDLTINTATGSAGAAGGAVTLGAFNSAGGAFVNDLTISRAGGAGGTNGTLTLNSDISLDNDTADAGDFTVTDAGLIAISGDRIIDTEQGDNGPAGSIDMALGAIAVPVAGRDLILDASTADAGSVGGNVLLPAIGTAGGSVLNDLTIHAGGGAGGGTVTLPTSIQLSSSADVGDFTITGASIIALTGDTTIDTDFAGGANHAGSVSFPATATINASSSLTIDASADGGGNAGAVSLGILGNTTPLTAIALTGETIDLNETHVTGTLTMTAIAGVNINASVTTGGVVSIDADSNDDSVGITTIVAGSTVNTGGADIDITGADLVLDGSIAAGAGTVTIGRSSLGAIRIGGTAQMGELGISGAELQAIAANGLVVGGTTTNLIEVENITAAQSAGITGITQLNATADTGQVRFITGPSTFNTLSVNADDGIVIDQDLTTVTGDMALNANSDGADDTDDSVHIAQDVDLVAGNDLFLVGNAVVMSGAAGTTNMFTSGTDGNVSIPALSAANDIILNINSQNNITLGTVQINNGTFFAVADSDGDGTATLATAGITAGLVDLAGGPDNNDAVDLNLNVTGASGVSVHNAAAVNVAGNLTVSSTSGDIDLSNTIAGIVLTGGDATNSTFSSATGGIRLAPVTATNNPGLTINTDGIASLTSIDVNTGNLVVDASVAPPSGSNINFSAGSISLTGSINTAGTNITLDGPVILTGPVILDTGAGAGDINLLSTVRSDSDSTPRSLTLVAGTGNIAASSSLGEGGILDQLLIQSANNASFVGGVTANSIRQAAGAGTTTFQNNLISQGSGGIELDGNAFVFQGAVVTTSQGAGLSVTNAGAVDFQSTSNIALGGAFLQDGTGAVNLAAPITTSLAPISFAGNVTIPAAITISNNGAGNITFGGTLTTSQPVTIDGGSNGSGNINFNGAVASTGELIARTGSGAVTFTNSVTANSALTAATDGGAITFNAPLSVLGALSASSTSGVISFVSTVTAGSAFAASTQSSNIQFGAALNGSSAGSGIFSLSSGTGDIIFNPGASVGATTPVQSFTAAGRNITVQGITTQGTSAAGDGDINLTPDLTVTQNTVPGQTQTDNRPNGLVRINGNLVANNGNINVGAAGRSIIPSVATTIVGNVGFSGGTLPTITLAANSGNLNFGANDKLTAFGNLSLVGANITFSDAAVLGFLSVNAGNNITLRLRPGALLLRPSADGTTFISNQVDLGSNIVANTGIGFTGNVLTTGTGSAPSFATSSGAGIGVPPQFPVAIRAPFGASDLRVGTVALAIDGRGTTDTGLATALAGAIPRDDRLGSVEEATALAQAEQDQLHELQINLRGLSDAELLDFLSGRSLYEDVVLDPDATSADYLVSVDRLSAEHVKVVLKSYRETFKKPKIDPATGQQMVDVDTGRALYEDRDAEIRDELTAALRRFRKEGKEGTLDPIEFRHYLERTPGESVALEDVESLQRFFEQFHLLGLGPKEESNAKRTLLGRICPSEIRAEQLEQTVMAKEDMTELE